MDEKTNRKKLKKVGKIALFLLIVFVGVVYYNVQKEDPTYYWSSHGNSEYYYTCPKTDLDKKYYTKGTTPPYNLELKNNCK